MDVAALIGRDLQPEERIAVAVSGGPDSLALLILAHRSFGNRVCALTVDHGLRAEAAAEAAAVAAHAASLGVAHVSLRWDGPHPRSNLQAAARAARYRLMGAWCAANGVEWLATAHHADDQAETLLMRLARGSGSGGLAGIRARRTLQPGVDLLRPLLGWRKADLAAVVAGAGWTPADDPSNRACRFDRTQARAVLATTPWLDPRRIAASAAHLADAEAALDWTAAEAWRGRVVQGPATVVVDAVALPRELARRLVLRAVAALAPAAIPRGPAVDRLLYRLAHGGGGTLGGVAVRARDSDGGTRWHFGIARPRR